MKNKKPQENLLIIETKSYLNELSKVIHKGLNALTLREGIKSVIQEDPLIGVVIPRTGGIRKFRYAAPGCGKSGGYRIIYYFYDEKNPVYLVTIYAKASMENPPSEEIKAYSKLTKELKNIFRSKKS